MAPPSSTPQWFTPVMGTAIVATAVEALPISSPVLDSVAVGAWALAVVLLGAAVTHAVRAYRRDRSLLQREVADSAVAPFFGAPPMALLAVGGATLALAPVLGGTWPVVADVALWTVGTAAGLTVAVAVPARQFTTHRVGTDAASPTWLLPVVAPMVSAATGAALADRLDSPALAQAVALACLAMAGAAGIAAALTIAAVWWRLAHHQHADASTVPALWVVLGPLGQSVTVLAMLALHAGDALPWVRQALAPAAILIGIPVLGFAVLWLAVAIAVAVRVAGRRLPYAMSWWSFTFPVGTCATGAAGLATLTGSGALLALAVAFLAALLGGWAVSAWGTVRELTRRRAAWGGETLAAADADRTVAATYAI
ncbi:C4-dicarboxylate ABC transporter [Demequina sp. NBRC 110057]|uniref:SLAC1 family transporter n=1 Tax=Demequina sp. NBRC 110057 TaxID=1570346 RepID=UPI0013566684|nr:C4-dicarboxylate ABC transporter [Demequina sp. NBRC 110057]